ncbi:type I restriction-modification system subunit M [Flavobacterium caseinilyticum]|uniref:site-specific DNA-methyltransferase (adenine-specific) n=1 Tax=Flavobacterium caseinilyticum TaxID=2541732 RepID=A0A4R5AMI2_9FLAO|nr:type I restriction-modification system subunit M [Flavobacterium caseinilyticum]TDD73853.1 type I restriction-modification system subunit M [Flavobacterium caseinilyticum]
MSDEQKKLLETQLWAIANILRGKISANQFQDYILGFIFYKYLSEKLEKKANEFLKPDGIVFNTIDENSIDGKAILEALKEAIVESLGYFLKPSELFTNLAKKGNAKVINQDDEEQIQSTFILEDLANVLNSIEKSTMGSESQDDFDNLFYDIDLNSTKIGRTTKDRNDVIVKILTALDEIDFDLDNTEGDVLGDAYEYLIAKFAEGAGQKAGEFYTPQQVSSILAKIVTTRKSKLKSVYDPTCGSGSLLLRVAREVEEVGHFYGQEQNRTTYNLARMNMILHDVNYHKFDIKNEDTLEKPQHLDFKFDAIVANPPFSAKWSANPIFTNDERFSQYGRLAPGTKADFAFIQHMVHQLDDSGIMACIAPHGVLFRGAAEGHIRKYLIEDCNYIDAIIGLPSNLFYGTSIPTCILVLKKCKETPENILFIDASNDFEKVKNQNVLREFDIDKIIETYQNRTVIDKYSNVATLEEVKANDYNLNIPRYVNTFEEAIAIDLNAVADQLQSIDLKMNEVDKTIAAFCSELQIKTPF